jgi:DNA invertase Pin-like site-specific DNA recombinase
LIASSQRAGSNSSRVAPRRRARRSLAGQCSRNLDGTRLQPFFVEQGSAVRRGSGKIGNVRTSKRCAIYLRVSTDEQEIENQEPDIERLVASRGFEIVARYAEKRSTKKQRSEFDRMLADAHAGHFNVVVVWALDRFGRDTIGNMIAVRDLDRLGVQLVSVREPWLDTTGPTRTLLVAIFSWVGEQEREQRSARTKAGLARVREKGSKSGKPIGRPRRLDAGTVARVRGLAASGQSSRQIAVALKVPRRTVRRALEAGQNGVASEPTEITENSGTAAPAGR